MASSIAYTDHCWITQKCEIAANCPVIASTTNTCGIIEYLNKHNKIYTNRRKVTQLRHFFSCILWNCHTTNNNNRTQILKDLELSVPSHKDLYQTIGHAIAWIHPIEFPAYVALMAGLTTYDETTNTNTMIYKYKDEFGNITDHRTSKCRAPRSAWVAVLKYYSQPLELWLSSCQQHGYFSLDDLECELKNYVTFFEQARYVKDGEPVFAGDDYKKHFKIRLKSDNLELLFNNQFVPNAEQPGTTGNERCNNDHNSHFSTKKSNNIQSHIINTYAWQLSYNFKQIKSLKKKYDTLIHKPDRNVLNESHQMVRDIENLVFYRQFLDNQGFYEINRNCNKLIDENIVIPYFQKYDLDSTETVKFKGVHKTKMYNFLNENKNATIDDLSQLFNGKFKNMDLVLYAGQFGRKIVNQ